MADMTRAGFEAWARSVQEQDVRIIKEEVFTSGTARVLMDPEWRCPICIEKFQGDSWAMQAIVCDTRSHMCSTDELFIAPVGHLSKEVDDAFGYLRVVALAMELDDQHDFGVQDVIEAIVKSTTGTHEI